MWGMNPSEFWRMHPEEFWWAWEAKIPPEMLVDKWANLYEKLS